MGNTNAIRAGRAFIEMTLNDGQLRKGLQTLEQRMAAVGAAFQKFGSVATAIGGSMLGAFSGAAKVFASTGAAWDDMSKKTGFSAKALSELQYAAEQSGADLGAIERGARGMEKFLFAASRGAAEVTETLDALGLTIEQLQGLAPEQQFEVLSAAVAAVRDPSMRAAYAMKAFGTAGSDLLPLFVEGPEGIAALRAEADRLGVTMGEDDVAAAAKLDDAIATLTSQFKGMFVQIGAAIAGPLTDFVGKFSEILAKTIHWIHENQNLVVLAAEVAAAVAGIGATMYAAGTAIGGVTTAVNFASAAMGAFVAHPVIAGVGAITATIAYLVNEFYKAHDAVTVFDEALNELSGKRTDADPDELRALVTRYDQLAAKSKLTNDEQTEARDVIRRLRLEYGKLETHVDHATGAIVGFDKAKAQLGAAQGGRSVLAQIQAIGHAELARNTRIAEGGDAAELRQRAEQLAKMREELERTEKIIADAKPLGALVGMSAAAAPPPAVAPLTDPSPSMRAAAAKAMAGMTHVQRTSDSFGAASSALLLSGLDEQMLSELQTQTGMLARIEKKTGSLRAS